MRDLRTLPELREHYEIERELASRLRSASRAERRSLYASLYDELFRRVPNHPQLTRRLTPGDIRSRIDRQVRVLGRFLGPGSVFLEVGPGDCTLAFEVARRVKKVYAVDVSAEITRTATCPPNFELILSDGCSIPVPEGSVDVAYSNQLMEHLHPDDALEQLGNLHRAIRPGGVYVCVTPNRLSGPHDVSRSFDPVARGLHLKEYTATELAALFRSVGFAEVRAEGSLKEHDFTVPLPPLALLETALATLPHRYGAWVARRFPVRSLLDTRVIATK
jgi:SAM-dependent methyltransferase